MARDHNDWTREEHILAFNLYCKIPFGTIHMNNPRVIELARLLAAVSVQLLTNSRILLGSILLCSRVAFKE